MEKPFPAYRGDEPYVFVSYAHADNALVYPELTRLNDLGYNIWYDEGISPGSSWRNELAEAIDKCSLFVIFITPQSAASENCVREVHFALEHGRPVLAIHLEQTEMPMGLELSLADRQAILKHELAEPEYDNKLSSGMASLFQGDHPVPIASPRSAHAVGTPPTEPTSNTSRNVGVAMIVLVVAIGIGFFLVVGQPPADSEGTPVDTTEEASPPVSGIAVMPFVNRSDDPSQEYFSDGLAEDILNGLVRSGNIRVVARTSSFALKGQNMPANQIGRVLGVRHVLEGSVRKAGNRIRVTVQLVDTETGEPMWSEQYNRELVDVFAVQDEITGNVLGALDLQFGGTGGVIDPPTTNTDAYNALLIGRYHRSRLEFDQAQAAFEDAILHDPETLQAYIEHARVSVLKVWFGLVTVKQIEGGINEMLAKAGTLDPTHPDYRRMQAYIRFFVDKDYQGAINEVASVVRENPMNVDGLETLAALLVCVNQVEVSLKLNLRRLALDPVSPMVHMAIGQDYLFLNRFEEAAVAFEKAGQLGFPVALFQTLLAMKTGDLEAARDLIFGPPEPWGPNALRLTTWRIMYARHVGDRDLERQQVEILRQTPEELRHPFEMVNLHLYEGDDASVARAFELMDRAVEIGEYYPLRATALPQHEVFNINVREDPRYEIMRRKYNLDDASLARIKVPPLPF